MSQDDFTNLWKKRQSDGKPRASVIGGLQRLLEEKDNEIIQLKENLMQIKEKLNQDVEILTQSEEVINQQSKKLDEYALKLEEAQVQLKILNKGQVNPSLLKPVAPVSSKGSNLNDQDVKQLKMKIKSLEDKLYVFSTLPDRIATLEEQKVKDAALIEEFEERERVLRTKLKKLANQDTAINSYTELEEENKQIIKENKRLLQRIDDLETESMSPKSGALSNSSVATTEWKQKYERARNEYEKLLNNYQKIHLDLENAKKAIISLKSNGVKAPAESDAKIAASESEIKTLKMELANSKAKISQLSTEVSGLKSKASDTTLKTENYNLTKQIDEFKTENQNLQSKIKESDLRYEELLFKYQQNSADDENASIIQDLELKITNQKSTISKMSEDLVKMRNELKKAAEIKVKEPPKPVMPPANPAPVVSGLVEDLQAKVDKQKRMIKKLQDENKTYASLKNKATKFEEIQNKNAELIKKNDEYQKELDQYKQISGEVAKLKQENESLLKENLKLKDQSQAAPPANQGDFLSLIQDLQNKVNKLKKENIKLKKELKNQ